MTQNKTDYKVGDMVLIKNHIPMAAFDSKYRPSFRICRWLSDKAFNVQDNKEK